ncbi:hypothetical protein ABH931_006106 [Streptacidiphilus sp. MAP12-33]|uniref:hypothetical protein n=1 Tax=Streptacidiphilus sp. MAP12-33 TaxID=3156266 RepID=UPI0035132212
MTEREQFIQGLRQLVDWLTLNPDIPAPTSRQFLVPLHSNAPVRQLAEHLGTDLATDEHGNCSTEVTFGPVTYLAYGYVDFTAHMERRSAENAENYAQRHNLTLTPKETAA